SARLLRTTSCMARCLGWRGGGAHDPDPPPVKACFSLSPKHERVLKGHWCRAGVHGACEASGALEASVRAGGVENDAASALRFHVRVLARRKEPFIAAKCERSLAAAVGPDLLLHADDG